MFLRALISGIIQNQRQKARRPRGDTTTAVFRGPIYGPFPNALPALLNQVGAEAGPSTTPSFPPILPGGLYGGASTSALPPVEGSSRRETRAPEGYATSTTPSQLAGPGIPGPSGHRTQSLQAGEPQSLTLMAAESRLTSRFSPVRPYTSASFATRVSAEPYRSSRSVRGTWSGLPRQSHSPLSVTLPPILPELQSGVHTHIIGSSSASGPFHSSHSSDTFTQRNIHIPPPFTLEPRPQWDQSSFSPFSRRPGSFDFRRSSSPPPTAATEGRDMETGPFSLLHHAPLVQGDISQAGASLPPPRALLNPSWSSRGSIPVSTETRDSRHTSAHSDDTENDLNITRSR